MSDTKSHNRNKIGSNTFDVVSDKDIVRIRDFARKLAYEIGFPTNSRTLIAMAVSEMCRNVIEYAKVGTITITPVLNNPRTGITIEIIDSGPGIIDLEKAMQDGFSTRRGMGMGLPGTRRIMDEFEITSKPGKGTTIKMSKWVS